MFSCEFCEISKNPFLHNTSGRLLLRLACFFLEKNRRNHSPFFMLMKTYGSFILKHSLNLIVNNSLLRLELVLETLFWENSLQVNFLTWSPETVLGISWYEVRDLQLDRTCLVCLAWNKFICSFKVLLREQTSNWNVRDVFVVLLLWLLKCCLCFVDVRLNFWLHFSPFSRKTFSE